MSAPRFSIITVCLDAEAYIADALGSVLAQTCDDYEYIVADGGSTDGTVELLRAYEPRFGGRMKWVSEPDGGIYDAMNRALGRTAGEYVEFLGADDRLRPGALAVVARAGLGSRRSRDIVSGATHVIGANGAWDAAPRRVLRRGRPARMPASHQSTFVRRETILTAGGFDGRFGIAADYDLYLRLVEAGRSELLIDDVLADFRLGGASSRSAWKTAREYRDVRVAHGASLLAEELAAWKSAAAATAFATRMRLLRRASGEAAEPWSNR